MQLEITFELLQLHLIVQLSNQGQSCFSQEGQIEREWIALHDSSDLGELGLEQDRVSVADQVAAVVGSGDAGVEHLEVREDLHRLVDAHHSLRVDPVLANLVVAAGVALVSWDVAVPIVDAVEDWAEFTWKLLVTIKLLHFKESEVAMLLLVVVNDFHLLRCQLHSITDAFQFIPLYVRL